MAFHFDQPKDQVILTVSGAISVHNRADQLDLDAAQLASLPQTSFSTSTVWTTGSPVFAGVLLKDFMEAVGAHGAIVTLSAENDYTVSLPVSEIADDGPLLALTQDGAPMSLRDKGPIWMVYPYDQNDAYRSELTYSRSIWQVKSISFHD